MGQERRRLEARSFPFLGLNEPQKLLNSRRYRYCASLIPRDTWAALSEPLCEFLLSQSEPLTFSAEDVFVHYTRLYQSDTWSGKLIRISGMRLSAENEISGLLCCCCRIDDEPFVIAEL